MDNTLQNKVTCTRCKNLCVARDWYSISMTVGTKPLLHFCSATCMREFS